MPDVDGDGALSLREQLASVLEDGGRMEHGELDDLVELADELSGLTLDGIRRRPAQLHSTQVGLQAQLLGLASGPGCTSFVESAKCAADVCASIRVMLDRSAALGSLLPGVGRASEALCREARDSVSARRQLALVLDQHDTLVEILEQPQLASSCVRNGLFDEVRALRRRCPLPHAPTRLLLRRCWSSTRRPPPARPRTLTSPCWFAWPATSERRLTRCGSASCPSWRAHSPSPRRCTRSGCCGGCRRPTC
eukprot:scaffold18436_cov122-Isochrysis_galbana.AAC.2